MRACQACGADISHRSVRAKTCSQRCNMVMWRRANPEKTNVQARDSMSRWRAANPELAKQRGTERRADPAYRQRAADRSREWYAINQEQGCLYSRDWRARNPGQRSVQAHRRRTRRAGGGVFEFSDRDWRRLVARYRGCCAYCGVKHLQLQREHVIPIARGGRHSAGNILPVCPRCNGSKKAKLLTEWRYQQRR